MSIVKKLKKSVWWVLNQLRLGAPTNLVLQSGLKDLGWFRSFYTKRSEDAAGHPIPWFTYSAYLFLDPRLQAHFRVFEYGSGSSTLYFAQKVAQVYSVEHHPSWAQQMQAKLPPNASVLYCLPEDYPTAIRQAQATFHLIVVDGILRNECIRQAVNFLTEDGVIIVDNSNRSEYREALSWLCAQGFRRLDFYGMAPIGTELSCTSFFYKELNCLNI
ncbi:MAG: hypothetical protein KatS3mg033_2328 [Thermonema sp.]|uniref:FkbM family methyltransferase n=1 Tax=Thermonema sp. TaxID=2231181 RepID=UPI0021DEFFF9|nr:FkbM family methyltransferase [Thermonema sp.]GIV40528.1 MAG: hypothetical protein KatS3mg033_2328 [Thermonema sp.]